MSLMSVCGGTGEDVLDGRAGADALEGRDGADELVVRDGGPDSADCGDGIDVVTTDLPGIDTLAGCEQALFATAPPSSTPIPGTTGAAGASRAADTLAPAFHGRVRADPARFRVAGAAAARGTRFRYTLSEAATVTFAVERKTSGRHANGRRRTRFVRVGSFVAAAAAGANATRFSGRLGTTTLRRGSYRVSLTAVDAAGNRSRPAKATFQVVTLASARRR
jgi:Ca2+-binding RTX toxin-like protein